MKRHDAVWLQKVEAHVRTENEGKAPSRRARGVGRVQAAAAAAAESEAWLQGKVEASVFARVLQDIEDRCLGCVRRVPQGEGWPARSWQQDGAIGGGRERAAAARRRRRRRHVLLSGERCPNLVPASV